jgi:hypothetical protein
MLLCSRHWPANRCRESTNRNRQQLPYGQKIHLRRHAYSRGLLMVITQEPTQVLAALNRSRATNVCIPREQQNIALSLMIPLSVEMLDIFAHRASQGALAEEYHFG